MKRWAPGGQQRRVALYTLGVCAVVFLINIFVLAAVWMLSRYPAASIEAVVLKVRAIFWLQGVLLAVAAVVLSFWVGRGMFSILGPVYRFTRYFEDLAKGKWDAPCQLRHSDKLHELKNTINGAVESFLQKVRDQNDLLRRVRYELQQPGEEDPEGLRFTALISEIASELADTERRLHPPEDTEEDVSVDSDSDSDSGSNSASSYQSPWTPRSKRIVKA